MHLDYAQLRPAAIEVLDGLSDGLDARAHEHDHVLGVGGAKILEQPVVASGQSGESIHRALDDRRDHRVKGVRSLATLEEDVRVLCDASYDGPIRIQSSRAMCPDQLVIDHGPHVVVGEDFDLADLVRRAESVEEVHERNARRQRGALRDEREVVHFLYGARTEHRPAGHPGGHDVGMIAKDRERLGRQRAGRDVEYRRRQLAGDLEHVRDHQQ